jgi:uncharacterized protein (TIGR03083 family)
MARDPLWTDNKDARTQIVAAYGQENRDLGAYLRELSDADWNSATLCSEWDVKGVVSHLIGQAVDFMDPQYRKNIKKLSKKGTEAIVPFMIETNQRHFNEGHDVPDDQLLKRYEILRGKVATRLAQIPPYIWSALRIGGLIPMRLHQALGIQVLEAWVHRQDIQRPAGASDGSGPFEALIPAVFFGIKNMRHYEPSTGITIDLGDYGEWSYDLELAGYRRGALAQPQTRIRMAPHEFVLLSAGRIDADDVQREIEGDGSLGMEFLYSAHFVGGMLPGL